MGPDHGRSGESVPAPTYPSLVDALRAAVARALERDVTAQAVVRGGDVAQAFRLELADGRTVFAKTHPDPPSGFFSTEAAGLRWLAAADAVRVPTVLAVSDGAASDPPFLVLEWVDIGPPRPTTEAQLGRALARLHLAAPACFGREDRRTTGSRGLPNDPLPTWAEFYGTQRLAPLGAPGAEGDGPLDHGHRRPRRGSPTLSASLGSGAPTSRRLVSTATSGRATGSWTSAATAGSSIPLPTAAIASSTSR